VPDDSTAENRLRELLHDQGWSLPPWPDAQERVRRAARRQRVRAVGVCAGAAAIAIAAIAVPLSLGGRAAPVPLGPRPSATASAARHHPAATYGMPSMLRAFPAPVTKGTGILKPGTPVPAAEIFSRADPMRSVVDAAVHAAVSSSVSSAVSAAVGASSLITTTSYAPVTP
jgi:hypothetical protein